MQVSTIWTIGHSTRTAQEFFSILKHFRIECLADIRHFPGSKKYPHFNQESMALSLPKVGIHYVHLSNLGGRRKADKNSENTAWHNPAFRGYADYMATEPFAEGVRELENVAQLSRTAIMCSEAVWWRCHRSLVADRLKADHWRVLHILSESNLQEHPFTRPAKISDGQLTYK
jgi:uncharacterized protein (DUF488 family)